MYSQATTTAQHVNPWALLAAIVAAVGGTVAYQWHAATTLEHNTVYMYDTPMDRCEARGVEQYFDRNEWPTAADGGDARALVQGACARNVAAFGADPEGAIQMPRKR